MRRAWRKRVGLPRALRTVVLADLFVLLVGAAAILTGCGATHKHNNAPRPVTSPVFRRSVVVGYSVRHVPIVARVVGLRSATRPVLIVGCVHGNEPAGEAITRALDRATPPTGTVWWIVDAFNPDGCRANTRQNADGVDLNRNSAWHWRRVGVPGDEFYSGTAPLSEPESRAINELVRRLRPAITIWYHQHADLVDTSSGGDRAIEARYARIARLPLAGYGVFPGSITTWQDRSFPADTAFVVELPAGSVAPDALARHLAAIVAVSG